MSEDQLSRVQAQFTRTAEVYAKMRQATDDRLLDGLVGLCDPPASARALDVACGPGFLTLALARRCASATGFDATDAFLELARAEARQRGQDNVVFMQGSAEQMPFENASFDLVTCRAAFHHFPKPERVLSELTRVTAPTGRILVADLLGNEDPEKAALHDQIERLCDPTHERALSRTAFQQLFSEAKLSTVLAIDSSLDYALHEWIDHGGPSDATRTEIVALMESWLGNDRAGLNVRREGDVTKFSHQTAAFVLEQP